MSTGTSLVHTVLCPSLPEGTFLLLRMHAVEGLSRPFELSLELLTPESEVAANDVLGQSMTISVRMPDSRTRYFNGLVSRYSYRGRRGGYAYYHATLRPWLWFLSKTSDCRIFQELSVPDIVTNVCNDRGFTDIARSLTGTYPEREYCVQYRESALNFIHRLLAEEGIYYFFRHSEQSHEMVLADSYSAHQPIAGDADIPYRAPGEAAVGLEHVSQWAVMNELETGSYVLRDFDFVKPNVDLTSSSSVQRSHTHADFEEFDFPGRYTETADGDRYAQARIESLQARFETFEGRGDNRRLAPGSLFSLIEYPRDNQNREYLILETEIEIESGEVEQFGGTENRFDARFIAIESREPFRPPRNTPKPIVTGPQTAIVVGKQGEDIWTDEYGRIKVQFHWDRVGTSDENSSCWVRVAQSWAGKNWGSIHIPRIGQEVVVDFLEGDPDRPLVTGRVYNADQMPPYALPDNQTQSGVKSRSTKEGTAEHFNEIRFEDKKDEEEIYIHAEKDFNRVVENNDTLKVGFEKKDEGNQTIDIHNNQTVNVGASDAADGSQTFKIWKDRSVTIDTGNDSITITQGNRTVKLDAGSYGTEAAQWIELKVGGSSIKIEPAKITIKAPEIVVQGDASLQAGSPLTDLSGDGTLTLTGGMVKIN